VSRVVPAEDASHVKVKISFLDVQLSSVHFIKEAADPASAPLQAGVTWSLTAPSDAGVVFEAEADVRQQGRGDGRAKVPLVASLLH
jgi:hypothetical protein